MMLHMEDSQNLDLQEISTPDSYLMDLTEYGIDEIEKGVCEDTYDNRTILRDNKIRWRDLYAPDGSPTPYIVAISPEAINAKTLQKAVILTDARDVNSDYETGVDLLLIPDVKSLVPGWIIASTREWNRVARERERTGKNIQPSLAGPPSRCVAIKASGDRCRSWTNGLVSSSGFCRTHMVNQGIEPNTLAKARNKMISGAVAAVTRLEHLMDTATSEQVQLKASTEILDRVGIRAGFEVDQKVEIEIQPARNMIEERLRKLSSSKPLALDGDKQEDIQDAEVIEQETDRNE